MRSHVLLAVLLVAICTSTSYAFMGEGSPFELCTGGNSQSGGPISSLQNFLGPSTFLNARNRTLPSYSGSLCPFAGLSVGSGGASSFSVGSGTSNLRSFGDMSDIGDDLCPFSHEISPGLSGNWMSDDWIENAPDTNIYDRFNLNGSGISHVWGESLPELFVD